MTTTTTKPGRVMATDETNGKRYVKTQIIEGAAVTVTRFTYRANEDDGWASAIYDVTSPPPASELSAGAVKWNGKAFTVKGKPAPSLTKAVRAVLGIEPLAAPKGSTRKPSTRRGKKTGDPRADRAAQAAPVTGGSVIVKDPETGLPMIDPATKAKADAIVAAQVARNAEAGK